MLFVLYLCLMAIGPLWSLNYDFPGGRLDLWTFVTMWAQELILLSLGVMALVAWVWIELSKRLHTSRSKK